MPARELGEKALADLERRFFLMPPAIWSLAFSCVLRITG